MRQSAVPKSEGAQRKIKAKQSIKIKENFARKKEKNTDLLISLRDTESGKISSQMQREGT